MDAMHGRLPCPPSTGVASTHLALQRQRQALQAAAVQQLHPRIARRLLRLAQQLSSVDAAGLGWHRRRCCRLILIGLRSRLPAVQVVAACVVERVGQARVLSGRRNPERTQTKTGGGGGGGSGGGSSNNIGRSPLTRARWNPC